MPFFSSSDKKPALIATTSATTKIIHPPEDISLVSAIFSRNFQNAKIRLDFDKFDNFTASPILREIKF